MIRAPSLFRRALMLGAVTFVLLACGSVPRHDTVRADPPAGTPDRPNAGARRERAAIPPVFQCDAPSDCGVTHRSCCGACGAARRGDAVAVNAAHYLARGLVRDGCGAGGSAVACPACAGSHDVELLATCRAGRCELVDLAIDASTACTQDADCRFRRTECCGCEGPIVAVATGGETSFRTLVCDAASTCTTRCEVEEATSPACVDGHCRAEVVE